MKDLALVEPLEVPSLKPLARGLRRGDCLIPQEEAGFGLVTVELIDKIDDVDDDGDAVHDV